LSLSGSVNPSTLVYVAQPYLRWIKLDKRRTTVRRSVFFGVVSCLLVLNARADQVTLKNGDRLTGTIVKSDAKTMLIKTELAGEVNVQWEAVTSIVSSQPLHLALKDGQTVVGLVTTADGKLDVATKTTGEVVAQKETVVTVRNDDEEKSYDAEMDRLRNPHLTDFWSGILDTGLSVTRGNSAMLAYSLSAKAARVTTRDKISVFSTAVYASDDTTPPSRTTAHAIRGGIRGDFNVSDRVFVFGFTDFEYDQFQDLDLRNVLGGGVGYHVIKTKNTTFDVFGGGDYEQEYFSATPAFPTGLTRKTGEVVLGEEVDSKLNGRTTLSEKFSLFPNVSDTGSYRFQFDATAATKMKAWLSWQITYSDRYLSNPLPGLKKNDMLLSTGLRLTFGKGAF
jgi:putative salt-induced outer membrane protein YdiY